jgi:large subunit ribosomal protein L18|uniref:Large ribosomal subunit protein uL18c n=2 Tax=Palmaria TaxID=2821 RepID=A0A6C0W267_PALDE|nr:50S ribosomal protein L18 [Palmaria decipiens]QIC19523.1 50S ribosomal protein L18 [Palmaria decipiens]BBI37224.1 50S ribosomal protein L18 [Palmaria palmata]
MNKKIKSHPSRPRLYVFRSNKHIYASLIDDTQAKVITSSSSISSELKTIITSPSTCEAAKVVGKSIADKCINLGIKQIVFDRGGKLYHGRIKALADAAREAGIQF